jgi:hypothetical protein
MTLVSLLALNVHVAAPAWAGAPVDSQAAPPVAEGAALDDQLPAAEVYVQMLEGLWAAQWGLPYAAGQSRLRLVGGAPEYLLEVHGEVGEDGLAGAVPLATGMFQEHASCVVDVFDHAEGIVVILAAGGTIHGTVQPASAQGIAEPDSAAVFALILELRDPRGALLSRWLSPMSLAESAQEAAGMALDYQPTGMPLPGVSAGCEAEHLIDILSCIAIADGCFSMCTANAPAAGGMHNCMISCAVDLLLCIGTAWVEYVRCSQDWFNQKPGLGG